LKGSSKKRGGALIAGPLNKARLSVCTFQWLLGANAPVVTFGSVAVQAGSLEWQYFTITKR